MDEHADFPLIATPEETKRRERGGTSVVERAEPAPEPEVVELTAADEIAPAESEEPVEAIEAERVDEPVEESAAADPDATIVRPVEPDPSALLKSVEALVQVHARLARERDEARQRAAALEDELAKLRKDDRASQLEARIAAALKALQG